MASSLLKKTVADILAKADITINGDRPWDIRVLDEHAYNRILGGGTLGMGEGYMAGEWECEQIDVAVDKIYQAKLEKYIKLTPRFLSQALTARVKNYGKKSHAFEVGKRHYDIGNDFYQAMLDKRMAYSCGYWKDAKTLDEAQEAKLDLICRKLGLEKGMTLLDIGGGWGSLAGYAAEHYGVSVVVVTISKEQASLGAELCKGLPVEFRLQDYRELEGRFDRVASVGMFEHVSPKHHETFMEVARRSLVDDGLFLLHTIGSPYTDLTMDPWIHKYIFPNGILPSLSLIAKAAERRFMVEDVQNFGPYYDKTLMAWNANFEEAWPRFEKEYGAVFRRMWRMYLLSSAGSFRSRATELYQVVLSPNGTRETYISPR